jgi:uncharacterized protein (DUF1697 family)
MPAKYLALLRGINVGGKNKLPMKELAEMFASAGCADVRTFIQSGNVIFRSAAGVAAKVPAVVGASITARFGYKIPIVLRSLDQLNAVVAGNPFLEMVADTATLHVMFLADRPGDDAVAGLDPNRSPGDTFIVRGADVYLQLPGGGGNSKLTNAYFDSRLTTVSTVRNWRTVTKLLELMRT